MSHPATVNTGKSKRRLVETLNYLDGKYKNDIGKEIREGLSASQKYIPCKYFYDTRGSKLFKEICQLPEYYPTRTEISILRDIAPELMETFADKDIVELGSGANLKIGIMLDAVDKSTRATLRYIPVDISQSVVIEASQDLLERYPELQVLGIIADFTSQLDVIPTERPLMFCFLGSTIGNMGEDETISFLQSISENMKPDDRLLVGFDMVKTRETVEVAYNDSMGVTAKFNKNILNVVNNGLNANFDLSYFDHLAFFNEDHDRIEMHLRANRDISVKLEAIDLEIEFKKGETIHTENSRKFTGKSIKDLATRAGLSIENWYSDPVGWFSLVVMMRRPQGIG
ncbi:MAG TPA: L-histidine N(alpha)-methyltransferase [Dehalococcoidia bacterium]|nr:L-histidine N(alpha)-methyltransferase [Dehalococcoidia bacterium]